MGSYFTIKKEGEGLIREKMSRFLSFAMHIETKEEAAERIKEFQNRFHDARHVCWAYVIGPESEIWQLNDNGEPSGTAGKPILGQIRSCGLTFTLVVVVRYFGGIKLGTSGLTIAYREAARMALDNAIKEEKFPMSELEINYPYIVMDGVMKIIKNEGIQILEKNFDNVCNMKLLIKDDDLNKISTDLKQQGVSIEI